MLLSSINSFKVYTRSFISTTIRAIGQQNTPITKENEDSEDGVVTLEVNPYGKEKKKCILCEHKIKLDYKNSRLLQQFVSSFSGRVYDKHITGLCDHQHNRLIQTIALSRRAGYMPVLVKNPKYLKDPKLFDPFKPIRKHSYA
uniref:28S ribosomal protein S18c, mitochondrial (inferred by orthology to a human protein) n=1 Tax=Strongyloides venezuelensis TaxID=75913 RepID=A0A0K0FKU0_STRVS